MMKGICRVCNELVDCCKLEWDKESGVAEINHKPFYLSAEHPPKVGCREGGVYSSEDGALIRNFCAGSIAPPSSLIQVH